jgi:D-glycero-beta-D-manno-heptose 1-phosphate adenylyltransferase
LPRQRLALRQPIRDGEPTLTQAPAFTQKIVSASELPAALAALPRPVVFSNGVFDVLHRGHVCYLAEARALGASLVLGLNSDASARLLGKGPDRPLNAQDDRAWVLAALESVSLVALFDESTPLELLKRVRPDLYVKGGDYDIETLAETALVRSWGGNAKSIPFVDGYSTTKLVTKIRG